ncbi:hypothetical protein [Kutzneria buriramensis]|uniref:Trypsin n=1 Tax=Kutzneria buriramensis TaxID=1045776 RepID=A0A3E0HEP5_9PSEU|nr:hypothetical protein [Kutzneria buriramensis]REH43712.1 hypothetical protein BCF44_109255 [Kutzneria buriramensis]
MQRRLRWLAAVAVAAAAVAVPVQAAAAGTPYSALLSRLSPSDQQLMRQQVPLADAGSAVDSALRGDRAHYAGVSISPENRQVVLYWHGAATPAMTTAVQRAKRELGGDGELVVRAARYSQAQLDAEANRLVGGRVDGGTVVVAAARPDASGLDLTVTREGTASSPVVSAVDTSVVWGSAPVPDFGRFNDTAPYNGGAAIVNASEGLECSSGFTVANPFGQRFLLTAGHCGVVGAQWQTAGGQAIGTTPLTVPQRDVELVSTSSAEPDIYNGGPDPSGQGLGESLLGISGARRTLAGEMICQLGAFSGPRCNIQILSHATVNINGVNIQEIKARTRDGSEGIGQGDSGGPVITLGPPGFVIALGINSAEDLSHGVACVGVPIAGRLCSTQMFFNDIADIQPATGTAVVIAPTS